MPKQLGSTLMFAIFLVAIAVAMNRAEENAGPTEADRANRGPASVAHHLDDESAAAVPFRHSAKLHGPVDAKIDLVGDAPAAAGDVFTLRGEITSAEVLERIEYRWSIPAGVELVSGSVNGDIARLGARQSFVIHLTLRARDAANAQVHLLATARSRGVRFAESAQFNSTRQKAFAESRARLSKSTAEHVSADELKVMH